MVSIGSDSPEFEPPSLLHPIAIEIIPPANAVVIAESNGKDILVNATIEHPLLLYCPQMAMNPDVVNDGNDMDVRLSHLVADKGLYD